MKNTIEDICEKLRNKQYINEEHVRFSLVGRILQETGWDIWNPKEVYTEFPAIKSEDNTRVDIALFSKWHTTDTKFPDVYIEIKSHSSIEKNLLAIEKQLRDYNRNNQATFTIITDGQQWLFYYSLTQGEFSDRKYLEINLLTNDGQQIEDEFRMFLSRENVTGGAAKTRAEEYLQLSHKERAIRDSIPEAVKRMDSDPLLNKVQAIRTVLIGKGVQADDEEIIAILRKDTLLTMPLTAPVNPKKISPLNAKTPVTIKPDNLLSPSSSVTTVLKVTTNGKNFQNKEALTTFKEVLRHWGIDRIRKNTAIKCKHPLLIPKEDLNHLPHEIYSYIDDDIYVYSNTSTFRKNSFWKLLPVN